MDDILNRYAEYRAGLRIWKSVPPILILLGTFGSVLTIVVLLRSKSRNSSTCMYLIALALSDLLVLWSGLLRQWIIYTFDFDVRHVSIAGCRIHVFIVYFATQCSSWILVAVTTERFIGVLIPHKVKSGCTQRAAGITISVIVLSLMLLNVHWFYGMGVNISVLNNVTYIAKCSPIYENYNNFLAFQWPWIDLCVFCLVPFTILFIGNISIIARVLMSKHMTRVQIAPHNQTSRTTDSKTSQLTAMLLTLNAVFFICATPISIYLIGEPHWIQKMTTYHDVADLRMWWAIVNCFMYLNNSLNFILYFLSGSRFREEVKSLFLGRKSHSIFAGNTTRVAPLSAPMQSFGKNNTEETVSDPVTNITTVDRPRLGESVA